MTAALPPADSRIDPPDISTIRRCLKAWYTKNHRKLPWRTSKDPYHIWVSEVMLQQTQVNTVVPYYRKFIRRFPDVQSLASADLQDVLKLWEGLGYYARARNLHKAAKAVVDKHDKVVPNQWTEFRSLPGVGAYIAAAVLSIAFQMPCPVVDGNVKRVLSRLFLIDAPVNQSGSYKQFKTIAEALLARNDPATFNQAVMELGALICKPKNPVCDACPVASRCQARRNKLIEVYPKRSPRLPVPEQYLAVGVIFKNQRVLIVRRPEKGLLGGLWEFPGGRVMPDESPASACMRTLCETVNLKTEISAKLTRIRHAYTHLKIVADIFICTYVSGRVKLNGPVDHQWVSLKALSQYPLPKANHKFLKKLLNAC